MKTTNNRMDNYEEHLEAEKEQIQSPILEDYALGFLNFSEKFHFLFSVGHSITNENYTTAYAGFLWTI